LNAWRSTHDSESRYVLGVVSIVVQSLPKHLERGFRPPSLHFGTRGPAQTTRDCGAVILALNGKLLAPLIEAKDLVVQVEEGAYKVNTVAVGQAVADLRINLRVRIVVDISIGTMYSSRGNTLEIVGENTPVIVRQSHARGDGAFVIGHIKIPVVGRLAYQGRISAIGAKPIGISRARRAIWIRRVFTRREAGL
jgi:hypothetical protein